MPKLSAWGDFMRKRNLVRILSFCAAALLVMGGVTAGAVGRAELRERQMEAVWRRSFAALASNVEQIDTALEKCLCSASPRLMGSACGEISACAREAQLNMSELPFSGLLLEKTSGFLGRLGDYSRALSRGAYGTEPGLPDRETLTSLQKASSALKHSLTRLQGELEQGMVSIRDLAESPEDLDSRVPDLGAGMEEIEDAFPELPTLIYDGPYSESVDRGEARGLRGLTEVSEGEAVRAASAFTGLPAGSFASLGRSEGRLPCWLLTARSPGGECCLRVTVRGGRVLDMVSDEESLEERLTPDQARDAAASFLRQRGFERMQESYWRREQGTLLVNYAPVQEGVVCYPDLVKVRVSLDSGRVVGYDGEGYLLNHCLRALPEPMDRDQAAGLLEPGLQVLNDRLAVIPTEGKGERCCREFLCRTEAGGNCLVYLDAVTGEEAKVLLLVEDDDGTLTV